MTDIEKEVETEVLIRKAINGTLRKPLPAELRPVLMERLQAIYQFATGQQDAQLEAALPADAGEDWIEWTGGPCPVPPSELVEVRYLDDSTHIAEAREIGWFWAGGAVVVAYRLCSGGLARPASAAERPSIRSEGYRIAAMLRGWLPTARRSGATQVGGRS